LQIDYPSLEEEKQIVAGHSFTPLDNLQPRMTWRAVMAYRDAVEHIPASSNVIDYAARLVRATRPSNDGAAESVSRWIRWGASPRASQNLILAGRARAACQGRFNVACEDVMAIAPMVLRHRIIRSFHADAEGKSTDDIVQQLLDEIPQDAAYVKR
jgi:MoxR-like ATPase